MNNLIAQMQTAEFYPHAVDLPISVIETHISWVFLTGKYAYKLKKPVNFGFLDFSTLAKRQFFIAEELRLNQRTAPKIYLEILPISQQDNKYILGVDNQVKDYVLKMRQFPQESLLINLAESGKLNSDLIIKLAQQVAIFHRQTATNKYIKSFGTVEVIKKSINDNYQVTKKYLDTVQTRSQYQATKQFTDDFLEQKKQVIEQRINQEKIRECHGDLHLKNICYWQNKIYLFDCIEFNEPFRFVDVIYDIAFTIMDLDARNLHDLGNIFLNTYLEQTGDWQGVEVLPLYLSRQAYVRAKVTSFMLDNLHLSPEKRQEILSTAQKYYHLAWQYTQPSQGQIILVTGLSGSGKTTKARQISPSLNAIHIRSDAVRKHLANLPLNKKAPIEIYQDNWTKKTYNKLLELGILLAKQGFTVILDATYNRRILREQVREQTDKFNLPLSIIYCHATSDILRQRLASRKNDVSDATPELISQQTFEPFSPQEQAYLQ